MIGIKAYCTVTGKHVRTVEDIGAFVTPEERRVMRNIGLHRIPTDNDRPLEDMIFEGYRKLGARPDCILIAHSLPFIRGNLSTLLPCGDIPTFYLSGLPCAIMHKAVDVACRMLENSLYSSILVIGADKAYSDKERVFFNTIMGDGVVLILLEQGAPYHRILSRYVSTSVYAANGENSDPKQISQFRSVNAVLMRNAIFRCMEAAGISEIDHFSTHTSNRKFWDMVSPLCNIPREKFMDKNICNTGHMNSHDSFFHYFYWCEQGRIRPGDITMLINPGFGGSQGCTLICT